MSQDYVGTYERDQGANMMITLDGDRLMAAVKGPAFQLCAESETAFFWKIVDAQIEFRRDSQGKITQRVVHQFGRDIVRKRK
jgi:hypothetical protein